MCSGRRCCCGNTISEKQEKQEVKRLAVEKVKNAMKPDVAGDSVKWEIYR